MVARLAFTLSTTFFRVSKHGSADNVILDCCPFAEQAGLTSAFNFADHRRIHGNWLHAASASGASVGAAVLEACSRQRRGFHLPDPHSRPFCHRPDSLPAPKP